MTITERFDAMRNAGVEIKKPLERFGALDGDSILAHFDAKEAAFAPGALSTKYKALIALSTAVALNSSPCIMNNTVLARENGATKAEIMETLAVAKFSKSATVISASSQALEWLIDQDDLENE